MTLLDVIAAVLMLAAPPQPTTPHVTAAPPVVAPPIPPGPIDTRHPWKITTIDRNTGEVTTTRSDRVPAASRFVDGVPVVRVEIVSGAQQACITLMGPGGKVLRISTGYKGGPSARAPGAGDARASEVPF